jgi:class 3 adenylate cyclase
VAATENITVLFTDLVGSTELASALTPEAGDEVRRKHFSALRQAIAASGGTEVKNLGDGLMVVFPAASTALSCAVAMQQAVDLDNTGTERPLGLRVGLSAGEATREADDYFGDPVIEAARLCARAEAGQILVADLVRANAGRRTPHTFSALGELELKGLPEPVETLEVAWEPLGVLEGGTSVLPLPSRLQIGPAVGVIGRNAEANLLADAFKRVANGQGREVVLVSGEAGMGKTTLATQAARAAFGTGAIVLLGRCDEDLGAPYGPFVEALSHYVTHAPEEALRAHVQSHGGELAKIVLALRQRLGELPAPQSTDPETERYLLYGAVVGLLGQISGDVSLVLVLDDLQWADKPSLQLLRHVVANTTPMSLLIVGTHRDSELSAAHPLTETLAALRRESGVSRIELTGLDDTDVIAFMEAAAGHGLDDAGVGLAHALYRETDGNPFFVGEVLLQLTETGAIYQDQNGRWTATDDLKTIILPDSVRQVIGSRVARLGEAASHVLPLASVIGREFDLDLLAHVTERSEDELLDVLDGAAAAALVREVADTPGRYGFSHALTQHTLYQDLGATRRARAHRNVAEAIEAMCGDHPGNRVGELAHHWSNATQPVDAAKTISYARLAAEEALASLAPDAAVRYFAQALAFFEQQRDADPVLGVDLLLGLGEAQRQAGIAAFRETFLDAAHRAQELGATDLLVTAALGNSRGFVSEVGVVDTDKVVVLEAALALHADDGPERALLLATLCSELTYGSPLEKRRTLADEAKAMAQQCGNPATIVRVSTLVHDPLGVPMVLAERLADTEQALALAEALDDPDLLFFAAVQCGENAGQAGDFELAKRCFDIMRTVSERLRRPMMTWVTAMFEAGRALVEGDPERAEQLAETALQIGTAGGQPDAFSTYGSQLIGARGQRGMLGELVPLIEESVNENPGLPVYRAALASAHLEAGDDAEALALLDAAAAGAFASLPEDMLWLIGVPPTPAWPWSSAPLDRRSSFTTFSPPITSRSPLWERAPSSQWPSTSAAWQRSWVVTTRRRCVSPRPLTSTLAVR